MRAFRFSGMAVGPFVVPILAPEWNHGDPDSAPGAGLPLVTSAPFSARRRRTPEGAGGLLRAPAVLLEVDGTLVDTVYHHALAWRRSMLEDAVDVPAWVLHRHVGMGAQLEKVD